MRDFEIRRALKAHLFNVHVDEPGTIIVDELGLCEGEARVDLAVVNGSLNGYEIKSERDTLTRLPGQQAVYNRVFDTMTIVVGKRYSGRIAAEVPEWWGVLEAGERDGEVALDWSRQPQLNRAVDPLSVARLLWRDEAAEVLRAAGQLRGVGSKPRRFLWQRLCEVLPRDALCATVRERLKLRSGWRADALRTPGGEIP